MNGKKLDLPRTEVIPSVTVALAKLHALLLQRPKFIIAAYDGDRRSYDADRQRVSRARNRGLNLLSEIGNPQDGKRNREVLCNALNRAYSGRLVFNHHTNEFEYTHGQGFGGEVRMAVVAVLEKFKADLEGTGNGNLH